MLKWIQVGLVVVAALAVAIGIRRLRYRIWALQHRAPLSAQVVYGALLLMALVLLLTQVISYEAFAFIVLPTGVVLGIWGWLRYRRSPYLQRREKTSRDIVLHAASHNIDATDAIVAAAVHQDDAERERLCAAALHDRDAALEFQRRTQAELTDWNRTGKLFARTVGALADGSSPGEEVLASRRVKLEGDLAWIRTVLSTTSGAD